MEEPGGPAPGRGPCLTPAVQIFTQFTRMCFNTRSEWRGVCTCAIAVCVRVCVHFRVLVSMAAADQAGACRGPPLLRLRVLNGADGWFPFTPLQAPPPGRPPPSFERSGAQNPTSCAAALPRSMSPGGKRPQLPLLGGSMLGLGCGRLLPSPGGKGKEASPGRPGPGCAASLTSSSLEPLRPSPPARSPQGPLPSPSAARRTLEQTAWLGPPG